jgi:hypothetical protein
LAQLRALLPGGVERTSGRSKEIEDKFIWALASNFKLQREFFRRHGGRVVLSAFGFHVAKDAMAAEWLAWELQGRWRFPNPKVRADIFKMLDAMGGDGVVEGERAKEVFAQPIWETRRK